ncbi:MAG: sodium:calcium antiporter [Gammaproteobacteria bacterium]|nr:sodium:calcium antiporter [Gammaproteobacteria bacterium]
MIWLAFGLCALVIGVAGYQLSRYGDRIADLTGLSRSWIGLVLVATATSLPELFTGVSAVALADVPNIAVGNILGATVMNLLLIVLLDFLHRKAPVFTLVSHGHILGAGFATMMLGLVGFNILLAQQGPQLTLGHIGIYTPVIVLLYLVSLRVVFLYEKGHNHAEPQPPGDGVTLRGAILRFMLAALVVVTAALVLPFLAEDMAREMGWARGFVGTLFVALVTTLPEIAVTVAALRLGSLDLAIGNLFGSILFNLAILAIDDLFFLEGPLLSHVDPMHAVSALSAVMMTGVAIVGLLYRPATRLFKTVGWVSLTLFSLYMLNAYVIFIYAQ